MGQQQQPPSDPDHVVGPIVEDESVLGGVDPATGQPRIVAKPATGTVRESTAAGGTTHPGGFKATDPRER